MLPSSTRTAGSMACRAQMQCVLRTARASRPMTTATAATATATMTTARPRTLAGHAHSDRQRLQSRLFTTSAVRENDKEDASTETATESAKPSSTETSAETPTETPTTESTPESIPWYLRVDVPKHATLTPQTTPLPAIPANAPPLMDPLVTFAADDLGLDDLKIMDLRGLDPPAALGPDLIMLFSTARSERHLHVSADRLVRWLRTFGVHATADGLLGRNELKIKLKRKARRAKLLGNIGQMAAGGDGEEVDDGISTKWVCVNAGFVAGGRAKPKAVERADESSIVDAQGRTTGFGSVRTAGTTVVVQIFTEAKRKQMRLEQLWARTLWHSLRKRRSAGEDVQAQLTALEAEMEAAEGEAGGAWDADKEGEDWLASLPEGSSSEATTSRTRSPAATSPAGARFYSTSARRLASVRGTAESSILATLAKASGDDDLRLAEHRLAHSRDDKRALLDRLALYVDQQATADDVVALVGPRGMAAFGEGVAKTDFVDAARFCMAGLSSSETWAFRAAVQAKLMSVGHTSGRHDSFQQDTLDCMAAIVAEMQRGGLACDRALAVAMLRGLVTCGGDRGVATALSLVRTLEARGGESVLAPDLLTAAVSGLARFRAVKRFTRDKTERFSMEAAERLQLEENENETATSESATATADVYRAMARQTRDSMAEAAQWKHDRIRGSQALPAMEHLFRAFLSKAADTTAGTTGLPLDDATLGQLLDAYIAADDWPQVWATWRLPVQHGRGRSPALYALLFQSAARTGDQARCIETLRFCVHEMMHETPAPVYPTGAVLRAMKACIRVADPGAEAAVGGMMSSSRRETTESEAKRYSGEFARLLATIDA